MVHTYQSLTFDSDTKASISSCILAQYVGRGVTKSYLDHIDFQETLVVLISSESVSVRVNICDIQYRSTATEYSMKGSALPLWKWKNALEVK